MTREEELLAKIQEMCDQDLEADVIKMIDALPDGERTYKVVGLLARTLSNLAGMIRSGYVEDVQDPDALDRRALEILAETAEEGKDDPNWWCRNGYTRMGLGMEAEAIPYFEHVMTLIPDDPETQEFWSDVPEAIGQCKAILDFLDHPKAKEKPYFMRRSMVICIQRDAAYRLDIDPFVPRIAAVDGIEGLVCERAGDESVSTVARINGRFYGEEFDMEIDRVEDFDPSGLRVSTYFNDSDIELVQELHSGYAVDMRFGTDDPSRWFHLQMCIADMAVPDMLVAYDLSACQALSGHLVRRIASSAVPPHPDFAYTIWDEADSRGTDVWLYTRGLQRMGLPDIEIMHSSPRHAVCHRKLIRAVVKYMFWNRHDKASSVPKIDLSVAYMAGGVPLYVRLLPWPEAIKDGSRSAGTPGSLRTRLKRMNSDSCVMFAYPDEQAVAEDVYQPLWMMDDFLDDGHEDDTKFIICEEENTRMHRLAMETFDIVERVARLTPEKVMLRLWLEDDDGELDTLWARLTKYVDRNNFEIRIEDDEHAGEDNGSQLAFIDETDERISTWLIEAGEHCVTPESIYLLDAEPGLKKELGLE